MTRIKRRQRSFLKMRLSHVGSILFAIFAFVCLFIYPGILFRLGGEDTNETALVAQEETKSINNNNLKFHQPEPVVGLLEQTGGGESGDDDDDNDEESGDDDDGDDDSGDDDDDSSGK